MAITDKEKGVWGLDQVYNKINQGSIWEYSGAKQLWTAGFNAYGKLGDNNNVSRSSPVQVTGGGIWDGAFGSGTEGALATKSDGTLWAWGRNSSGGLGHNNRTDYSSPVQIPGSTWASDSDYKLSCQSDMSAAIKTDNTLWTWGNNYRGGLGAPGIGYDDDRSSPVQIPGTTWKRICTAGFGQLAVKTNGTMWSWGSNVNGVLGTNQTAGYWPDYDAGQKYSSPVQIPGTTWDKIPQSGTYSRFAIRTDGTLWSWGANTYGTLGLNNRTSYSSPVQIPGTTWNELYTGRGGTECFITKTDGTLWAWGRNNEGQMGQNNRTYYSSPTQIPGTTWNKVSTGGNAVFASKTDGTYWSWGGNYYGHQGNNTRGPTGVTSSPVQVPGDYSNIVVGGNNTLFQRNA